MKRKAREEVLRRALEGGLIDDLFDKNGSSPDLGVVLAVLMSDQDGLGGAARGYVGEAMARSRRRQKESPLR